MPASNMEFVPSTTSELDFVGSSQARISPLHLTGSRSHRVNFTTPEYATLAYEGEKSFLREYEAF